MSVESVAEKPHSRHEQKAVPWAVRHSNHNQDGFAWIHLSCRWKFMPCAHPPRMPRIWTKAYS